MVASPRSSWDGRRHEQGLKIDVLFLTARYLGSGFDVHLKA
jgi:hypothetical protein